MPQASPRTAFQSTPDAAAYTPFSPRSRAILSFFPPFWEGSCNVQGTRDPLVADGDESGRGNRGTKEQPSPVWSGQNIPILKALMDAPILVAFQGLVKVAVADEH